MSEAGVPAERLWFDPQGQWWRLLLVGLRTSRPWHPLLVPVSTLRLPEPVLRTGGPHGAWLASSLVLRQGTSRETLFRCEPTRKMQFQRSRRFCMPQPSHPCVKVPPSSTWHLTSTQKARGIKVQTRESHCLVSQPQRLF